MSFYWLFGTFHVFAASALYPSSFEPSSFSSSLTGRSRRTPVSAYAQGHFLRSNPNWKRLMLMTDDWCAAPSDSHNACNICSAPTKLRSKGESQGRHLDPGGGFTRKHDRRGPNGQLPCILDRQKLPRTLRNHVESASALSALKKSLVASLSAKRQLSVAKLSAKRIFSLAKRDFLVANGRMAADFSSPA